MTDLVHVQPRWVDTLPVSVELAERLAPVRGFVPDAFVGRPEAVLAAILTGDELGLGPMQSLKAIYIVNGVPGIKAETQRALILAAGHDLWVEESTTTRFTLCGRRIDSQHTEKVTWTMDDAKRAGLAGRDTYRKHPRAMLLARATSELARQTFPDVTAGLAAVEELTDEVDFTDAPPNGLVIPEPPKTKRRAAAKHTRKKATKKAIAAPIEPQEPPLPDEPLDPPTRPSPDGDPDDNVEPITKDLTPAQRIAITARNIGVDHHHVLEALFEGTITSANDLNDAQAEAVRDALRHISAGDVRLTQQDDRWLLVDIDHANDVTGPTDMTGPVTQDQVEQLRMLLEAGGIGNRHAWIVDKLNRPIESWTDMNAGEADMLIRAAEVLDS